MLFELKLLVNGHAKLLLEQTYLPSINARTHTRQLHLFNQYFDTEDRQLSKHGIGFRIRSHEDNVEQTVKTAGSVVGGLHQRPEYNIPLQNNLNQPL